MVLNWTSNREPLHFYGLHLKKGRKETTASKLFTIRYQLFAKKGMPSAGFEPAT